MVDNSFFLGLRALPTVNKEVDVTDCEKESSNNDVIQSRMTHFRYDPENFFQKYEEDTPEMIVEFLNSSLEEDIDSFVELYRVLLRRICLNYDKTLPLQSLWEFISDDVDNCNHRVITVLRNTVLAEETLDKLAKLHMKDELERFISIVYKED